MNRATARTLAVATLAATLAQPGCAYESAYVAPLDGRARLVWKGNDVVADLAGAPAGQACLEQLAAWSPSGHLRFSSGDIKLEAPRPDRLVVSPAVAFWVPIYFGAPIIAPAPGIVPLLPQPVLFAPSLALPGVLGRSAVAGGAAVGGGANLDLGKFAVALAVIALVVLPIVDISVAAEAPEGSRSSEAIEQVNVFNDLARSAYTPCTYGAAQ
jgi:hypothetical protein